MYGAYNVPIQPGNLLEQLHALLNCHIIQPTKTVLQL